MSAFLGRAAGVIRTARGVLAFTLLKYSFDEVLPQQQGLHIRVNEMEPTISPWIQLHVDVVNNDIPVD